MRPALDDYDSFVRIVKPVQWAIDILTCALVFFMARRLGGWVAAWPAFLLAVANPFLILYASAILTETLATFWTTLTLALLIYAGSGDAVPRRARIALILSGVTAALNTLVRIDGALLLPCLGVPLLFRRPFLPRRTVLLALLALALTYSPWIARNLKVFGHPHPLSKFSDIRGREVSYTAFLDWFATWV